MEPEILFALRQVTEFFRHADLRASPWRRTGINRNLFKISSLQFPDFEQLWYNAEHLIAVCPACIRVQHPKANPVNKVKEPLL